MGTENDELESFRRQWLEEVASRSKSAHAQQPHEQQPRPAGDKGEQDRKHPPPPQYVPLRQDHDEVEGGVSGSVHPNFEGLVKEVETLSVAADTDHALLPDAHANPTSALEHFEQAARKEDQGMLGDSLDLYRKAYKLDSDVDKTYRKKHFPPSALKAPGPNPSNAPATLPNTAHHSSDVQAIPTRDLIASFARLPIPVADPIIDNTPPPPCPISKTPSEVLAAILERVALLDPASLARVALVCKRLAYHVAHEQHIWRRICQGPEFGFASMHYSFICDIKGNRTHTLTPRYTPFPFGSAGAVQVPKPLLTWSQVFQTFPRIRFTGIYISTVNYTRPGTNASFHNVSWNSPIHIVTYYRYLRFYPDGSLISLLTTTKPIDVVPHISKENVNITRTGVSAAHRHHQHHTSETGAPPPPPLANPIPPTAASALKNALRGRWHLTKPPTAETDSSEHSSSAPGETASLPRPSSSLRTSNQCTSSSSKTKTTNPGTSPDLHDVFVETEGVDQKYIYAMHLALRSSGTGGTGHTTNPPNTSKNTKLAWKGFWSYNRLTDDWAEFGLRNDRAFVFRRVKGWGMNY